MYLYIYIHIGKRPSRFGEPRKYEGMAAGRGESEKASAATLCASGPFTDRAARQD